jgi:enediyne biosynthesis protein E4
MANGHVFPEVDSQRPNDTFGECTLRYSNEHNRRLRDLAVDSRAGITTPFSSHGAAADLNNDGGFEIVVNNSHDRPRLLKNLGDQGNWFLLKLEGIKSNGDAIGAKVTVRVGDSDADETEEVRSGGGFENIDGNRVIKIRESIGVMKN